MPGKRNGWRCRLVAADGDTGQMLKKSVRELPAPVITIGAKVIGKPLPGEGVTVMLPGLVDRLPPGSAFYRNLNVRPPPPSDWPVESTGCWAGGGEPPLRGQRMGTRRRPGHTDEHANCRRSLDVS